MKIHKHIEKGESHKVFCEDFLVEKSLTETEAIIAVFDGCSSGKNSHLASSLAAKVLENSLQTVKDGRFIFSEFCFSYLKSLFDVAEILNLSTEEFLTTCILAKVSDNKIEILAFGDGLLKIDDQFIELDEQNSPDYFIYHKNKADEELKSLLSEKINIFENCLDISIATDGISSFVDKTSKSFPNISKELLTGDFLKGNPSMLTRKLNILKKREQIFPLDDVSVIRVCL